MLRSIVSYEITSDRHVCYERDYHLTCQKAQKGNQNELMFFRSMRIILKLGDTLT